MQTRKLTTSSLSLLALLLLASGAAAAPTQLANSPISGASSVEISPNVMFVLDDSGSMAWDFLPDWAESTDLSRSRNAGFNGIAYNPALTYTPPKYFSIDGVPDTTTYPSQTAANTTTWTAVKDNGYDLGVSASTRNLVGSAFYYTTQAGEFCTNKSLKSCATTADSGHPVAAKLRWCKTAAESIALTPSAGACQALRIEAAGANTPFEFARLPSPRISTITLSGTSSTSISSITVSSLQILSVTIAASTDPAVLATNIAASINACTFIKTGTCGIVGYSAVAAAGRVTISAPGAVTTTPAVTKSGSMSVSTTAFARPSTNLAPGENLLTVITSTTMAYPKTGARSDCAADPCTYAEEMTNYANWWAYYRTRMLTMKTAASLSFEPIGSRFRIGYMTINNNTSTDFQNIDVFNATQKKAWYDKLFSAVPNLNTPLRVALSNAGRLYAGRLNETSFNGVDVVDPVQFYCQPNVTILSTDGYWNEGAGFKWDGSTAVGDQDGPTTGEVRPQLDGGGFQEQKATEQMKKSTTQAMAATGPRQKRTSPLQTRTRTGHLQELTGPLQAKAYVLQQRVTQVRKRTSSDGGLTWTAFGDVASCSPVTGQVDCVTLARGSAADTPSCTYVVGGTTVTGGGTDSEVTTYTTRVECSYRDPGWANTTSSCTVVNRTTATTTGTVYRADAKACQYNWGTTYTDVDSCTAAESTASPYTVILGRRCQRAWSDWVTATGSCTSSATVECRADPDHWTDWVDSASCSAGTSGTTVTECRTNYGTPAPVAPPCTAVTTGIMRTTCSTVATGPTAVDPTTCTAAEPSAENDYVKTTCPVTTTGPTDVASCTPADPNSGNSYTKTVCSVVARGQTPDTLADVAQYYWKTDLRDPALTPDRCTGGPVVTGEITVHNNVCTNDALKGPRQNMITYTLGLGASGLMGYDKDYPTATSGDFYSIKLPENANPDAGICPWQPIGTTCNWPKPESNAQTNIDDLWHAAVNGRGTYFSASDPSSLAGGISSALQSVEVKAGALAAVTVTSPNLVADEAGNSIFEVSFTAGDWSGDLVKRTIDGTTGAISATPTWSAQAKLDAKVSTGTHAARKILTFDTGTGSTTKLKSFLWDDEGLSDAERAVFVGLSDADKAYFAKTAIAPPSGTLTQFCTVGTICLPDATQTAASGKNLVNFLRGDKSNEGALVSTTTYYRQRAHLLADIVGSEAVYVKGSPWNYADYRYGTFKASNASRTAMVYIGANDGMLHAFNESTGEETWAYVPALVLPTVYKLADKSYSSLHQFTVDGTPVMADICASDCATPAADETASPVWKTILVGGLNHGGRGYYALDITTPASPKALWEFTHDNLGYSYGNPVITKLKDGTWVVIVASGYNNVGPGNGKGYLFILNADSGALIRAITTDVGDTTTPSGLARITAWANFPDNNNTAQRVYGGDLLGNLWRFDINGDIPTTVDPPVYDAQRLATLKDAGGVAQPITSKPELGKIAGHPVVFVATGQLLGADDLGNTQTQSFYAIKDRLINADYGSPRPLSPPQTDPVPGDFVHQTLTSGTCGEGSAYCNAGDAIVTSSSETVDFNTNDGWYVDFPVAGERVSTDLRLQLGTLTFNTSTPTSGACAAVGVSFAYFLDYRSGGPVEGTDGLVGARLGEYLATAPSVIRLVDGTIRELIRTDAPGTISKPVPTEPTPFDTRRVSWRELVAE
ncbi:MAG: PilC/PilY family type IV pilus protein [Candidatus Accumulibacter propinquus]|jgi:type IV pilus assembly protein PilY1|uniref:pilus assembly protein n=1 Tax=Candidatus Accumulibacter propinquus TaxID=2954380 RepID=UPI002FC3627E